jgi:hypothetical protein
MDRFTRFKILRALWARAKHLLAWLHGPREREARLRAHRWQQINIAERHIRDGMIRGTGDPDSYIRPQGTERNGQSDYAWRAQLEAQPEWHAAAQRSEQQRREQQRRGR